MRTRACKIIGDSLRQAYIMLRQLRYFCVFQMFLFWQGGFLFYSAVVVPTGTEVLDSAKEQGLITQRVTDWLNIIGVVWVLVFAWDLAASGDFRRFSKRTWLWAITAVLLGMLFYLHPQMDGLIDASEQKVTDRPAFRTLHIVYLWVSTLHWLLGLILAWLTLRTWTKDAGP